MSQHTTAKNNSIIPPDEAISLLGCGWLGLPLAQRLISLGRHVLGSTTTPAKLKALASLGIEPILLRLEPESSGTDDVSSAQILRFFSSGTLVLNIPPSTSFGPDFHSGQVEGLINRLLKHNLRHFVYVSSTSVYGANQGEVDESTAPTPDEGSGRILLEAENRLARAANELGFGLTIVRPGGLIGIGRHPGTFLAGRSGLKHPDEPVNLIHQSDLVDVLVALIIQAKQAKPAPGEVCTFNAVSRLHPSRREFYTRASELLALTPPTFVDETESPRIGKLVRAEKIRAATGVQFRFDDLLAAMGDRRL